MTNVLIPTDFTVQSLELIIAASQNIPGKLNIFLFHAFDMPDSLIDAMHRTGIRNHNNLITEDLRLKCRQIKMTCPDVANISFKLMFGSTPAVFKNFAEANDIHIIAYPSGYKYIPVVRESVNPDRMFLRSRISVVRDLTQKNKVDDSALSIPATRTPDKNLAVR